MEVILANIIYGTAFSEKSKATVGNVYLCKSSCTAAICLSICYDYPCLRVVSADVACIPMYTCMYTRVALDFSLNGTV